VVTSFSMLIFYSFKQGLFPSSMCIYVSVVVCDFIVSICTVLF